jgi:hypothetical protein
MKIAGEETDTAASDRKIESEKPLNDLEKVKPKLNSENFYSGSKYFNSGSNQHLIDAKVVPNN